MNQGSFHNQKSPKVSGSNGIKQLKISGNHNSQQQKNVRIMLVGNNGMKQGN